MRDLGLEITAVPDSGAARPPSYAAEFAARHGIPTVASTLEELSADVAVLLGVDWVEPESLPDDFSSWDAAAYTAAYTPPA